MPDLYKVSGVACTANQDEIKRAYRCLAKEFHPDLHPDRPRSRPSSRTSRPPTICCRTRTGAPSTIAARSTLPVPNGPKRTFYRHFADHDGGGAFLRPAEHYLWRLFHGRQDEPRPPVSYARRRGCLGDASRFHRGGDRRPQADPLAGAPIEVDIPAGIRDGQTIRIAGKGNAGLGGGPPGDALIRVQVEAHPWFGRKGNTILLELPVTLAEAVLGARVTVPTIEGPVMLTIPRNANTGTTLRLKGKGIRSARAKKRGDQLVKLKLVLPGRQGRRARAIRRGLGTGPPLQPAPPHGDGAMTSLEELVVAIDELSAARPRGLGE